MEDYCEVCGNERVISECFLCKEPTSRVALVNLVYTWEPFDVENSKSAELHQVMWHKECYENRKEL